MPEPRMSGLMQDWSLTCTRILDHAARNHPDREVVSRSVEGPIHRTTYRTLRTRSLQLAKRLQKAGIREGDRVATLAWNTWRHMEAWYGLMGIGAVYHTVNPRLFPDQIIWIINHAEDRFLLVDVTFLPLVEKVLPHLTTIEQVIVLTDEEHLPATGFDAVPYEEWLAETDADFAWVELDENAAAGMCYTSGTTGNPKGVVYSHRSNVLHALTAATPDMLGLSSRDRVMPVVPLFHANGWSLAFSAPMSGAALVMPGPRMDGEALWELLDSEQVSLTAAVPTIWLMLLQHLEASGRTLPYLERVVIGGSACPRAITKAFEEIYDVRVRHAWGMTEMSPLGSVCAARPEVADLEGEALLDLQEKQGFAPFGVEMKVTDDEGRERPWDGKTFGRLKVRGPAVARTYFKEENTPILDDEGFFDTGDVAHIDAFGYMQITDRAKDVIKSGGEWISTIDLENLALLHPDVAEAAAIGVPHPKWDERPLLVVVAKEGRTPSEEAILKVLEGRIASWWMPNAVVFVDEIPHTATGKIQKTALREQFADFRFADTG